MLNATLQLNADDNSGEQIIRIRDKESRAAAAAAAEGRVQSTSSRGGSTLLDTEHQHQVSGGDGGPAKVNLHEKDTRVNISSQVGISTGQAQVAQAAAPTTTTAATPTMRTSSDLVDTRTSSTTPATKTTSARTVVEHHSHRHVPHEDSSSSSHDYEDDEDEEGDDEEVIKVGTTTVPSKLVITAQPEGDKKRANSVINGNYTDSSALGVQSEVVVHDNGMNIERAIGENGEQMIIIAGEDDDDEVVNVHKNRLLDEASMMASQHKSDSTEEPDDVVEEPIALPLRPIIRDPFDEMDDEAQHGEMSIVYAELHSEVQINCEVDMDIAHNTWFHDGQVSVWVEGVV